MLVFIFDHFEQKLMTYFLKKIQKLYFGAILGPFCPNLGRNNFFIETRALPVFKYSNYYYEKSQKKGPIRHWSRGLIWASVELCQVESQPKLPQWLLLRDKIFNIFDNSGQLVPTFSYLSIDRNIKRLENYCVNVFWFNIQLAKKSYRWQFFILTQNVSFSFSTFLEFEHPK